MASKSSKTSNNRDPGWDYNHLEDLNDPKKRYRVICDFCGFTSSGGISRAKEHQLGGFSNVKPCEKVPPGLKEKLQALYGTKQESNVRSSQNEPDFNIGDDVEVEQAERNSRGKRALVEKPGFSKAKKTKILMDLCPQKPGEVVDMRKKQGKLRQTSMSDSTDPARERTIQYIARFFDEAGIPFDAAQQDSFMDMVEAIGKYGLGLKPPSDHELKVPLLMKKMQLAKNYLKNHQEKGAKTNENESTYDAAGSFGGSTAQSSPHNEEFQLKELMAFCGIPGIKELWKVFSEVYREINKETSKGKTEEEQEFSEEFKKLSDCCLDMTEVEEKWLDEWCKRELNSKLQERFKKIFEEGITEKFEAAWLKYEEEDKRQYREEYEQLREEFEEDDLFDVDALLKFYPEMLMAGSLNVSSNWEGELQSSSTRTMPLTANAMKSTATGGTESHHDPLAMQGVVTAAAESSGRLTTQSSLYNAKV